MKQSIFATVIVLTNYVFTSIAFLVFLNWYDTGQIDINGWWGMAIGGLVFGIVFVLLENRISQCLGLWPESILLFFLRHILINGLSLIGSFALGYAVELMFEVQSIAQVFSILPMLLVIPFMATFYSIMMIPFGVFLGITNGLLFRVADKFHQQ